jgi:predicted alpha/beta-hydrolase family hydrolase
MKPPSATETTIELPSSGPQDALWTLILAHGAGQGMDSAFMVTFADGLANRGHGMGGLRVVRFEFPYMVTARREGKSRPPDREPVLLECWRTVIDTLQTRGCPRERLVIGGKSLGGRMASLIADEQSVAGLICLGYPFHPPGKPTTLRTAHLQSLKTPTLICQGTRDPFGTREEVLHYELSSAIWLHWVEDGEHSFKPRKASGLTEMDNWNAAMEAVVGFIGQDLRSSFQRTP